MLSTHQCNTKHYFNVPIVNGTLKYLNKDLLLWKAVAVLDLSRVRADHVARDAQRLLVEVGRRFDNPKCFLP